MFDESRRILGKCESYKEESATKASLYVSKKTGYGCIIYEVKTSQTGLGEWGDKVG